MTGTFRNRIGTIATVVVFAGLLVAGVATAGSGPSAPRPDVDRAVPASRVPVVLYLPATDDPVNQMVQGFVAPTDSNADVISTVRGIVDIFQKTAKPGSPKVDLIPFTGTGSILDSVAQRADAVTIATKYHPFLVWGGPLLGSAFADELTARGVMCVQCITSATDEFYAEHAPFVWSLQPTPDQIGANLAAFITRSVGGHPAVYAGDPTMHTRTRRFGLIFIDGPYVGGGMHEAITRQLDAAGVHLAAAVGYTDPISVRQVQSTEIARLRAAGVTTVTYAGDPLALRSFTDEATAQDYHPEWLMSGTFVSEFTAFARDYDPTQMRSAFGITPLSLDPDGYVAQLYTAAEGHPPAAKESLLQYFAPPLLFYTAVGHLKPGAPLTPRSFAKALFDMPPLGGDPKVVSVPLIGFGTRLWPKPDYAGIDDFSVIWWNADWVGPDERGHIGHGRWEFADEGKRYRFDTLPEGPPHVFGADS